jgi:methionyl-tRNA formyltransferase
MKKLSIAYFGTPSFSANFLEKLITDTSINRSVEVKLVVTQEDKPAGRKQIITKSPVKVIAEKFQIPTLQINQQKSEDIRRNQKSENPDKSDQSGLSDISVDRFHLTSLISADLSELDLALVFAYGNMIPKELLNIPKYGFWCIHPSLLPKYRGASPIAYPIIFGDKETGVSIIQLDEKMDHGPIIAQEKIEIPPDTRRPDMEIKLTSLAFFLFKDVILNLFQDPDSKKITLQNHDLATYSPFMTKDNGFIPLVVLKKALKNELLINEKMPEILQKYYQKNNITMKQFNNLTIYNIFRGLHPWPGIWTLLPNGKRLKIIDLSLHPTTYHLQPIKVQLEGKKEVDFETFNKAYKIF